MKRFLFCLTAVCSLFLFAGAFLLGLSLQEGRQEAEAFPCYAVLYPYKGRIGVYKSPAEYQRGQTPGQIIQTPVEALPLRDQNALKQGIILKDRQSCRSLAEDFDFCLIPPFPTE